MPRGKAEFNTMKPINAHGEGIDNDGKLNVRNFDNDQNDAKEIDPINNLASKGVKERLLNSQTRREIQGIRQTLNEMPEAHNIVRGDYRGRSVYGNVYGEGEKLEHQVKKYRAKELDDSITTKGLVRNFVRGAATGAPVGATLGAAGGAYANPENRVEGAKQGAIGGALSGGMFGGVMRSATGGARRDLKRNIVANQNAAKASAAKANMHEANVAHARQNPDAYNTEAERHQFMLNSAENARKQRELATGYNEAARKNQSRIKRAKIAGAGAVGAAGLAGGGIRSVAEQEREIKGFKQTFQSAKPYMEGAAVALPVSFIGGDLANRLQDKRAIKRANGLVKESLDKAKNKD